MNAEDPELNDLLRPITSAISVSLVIVGKSIRSSLAFSSMGPIQDLSFFPFSLSSLPLLLLLFSALSTTILAVDSSGWSVVPSNNSRDLSWVGKARFHLESAQIQLPSGISVTPLTTALVNLDQSELTVRAALRG